MSPTSMARINAAARVAIGGLLMAAPAFVARNWIGKDGNRPAVQVLARAIGARDVAIGAGTLAVAGRDRPLLPWVVGALLADATDAVAMIAAGDALPRRERNGVLAVAVGAALQNAWIAANLSRG